MNAEQSDRKRRAAVHAALGDPGRLAIVDALALGEVSPSELQRRLAMPSNLLAHHVKVLQCAGVVTRKRSEGDRRRTYLALAAGVLDTLRPTVVRDAARVVFVCTQNSARSQLAAALWGAESPVPAASAGTHPARAVHPGAVAAARRRGVPLATTTPRHVDDVLRDDDVVITVCDAAHEELGGAGWLHWSIADPARRGDEAAFDHAVDDLTGHVVRVAPTIHPTPEKEKGPTDA